MIPSITVTVDSPPTGSTTALPTDSFAGPTSCNVDETCPICIDTDDEQVALVELEETNPPKDIAKMVAINMTQSGLKYFYELSNYSLTHTLDCILASLRNLSTSQISISPAESPHIRLDNSDDKDDWTDAAIAFYKHSKFNNKAGVRISIRSQSAVDTGGVCRQFFSVVLSKLAQPSFAASLSVFEGLPIDSDLHSKPLHFHQGCSLQLEL